MHYDDNKKLAWYYYIRFYADDIMVVPVTVERKMTVDSWFKIYRGENATVNEIDYRKGIPIYRKN